MASSISNSDLNFRSYEPTASRKRSTPEGGRRVEHSVTKVAHSIRHPSEAVEVDSSEFNVVISLPPRLGFSNPPPSHQFQSLESSALPSVRTEPSPILYRIKEINIDALSKNTFNFVRKYVNKEHIRTEDALYFKNKKLFYKGETKHGIPHGTGTMHLSFRSVSGKISNIVIAGKFFEGKPHGYAVLTDPQKIQYKGYFKSGLRDGKGTLTSLNGDTYVGEFKNDQFDGKGELTTASGDLYKGGFKAGLFDGFGTFISASSSDKKAFYVGGFKEGLYDGIGKLMTAQGDIYQGGFKNGRYDGIGELTTASGDKYVGEFKDGLYHGEGTLTTRSGVTYVGGFEAGKKQGEGVETNKPYYEYEGEFENNYFHGHGTLTLPSRVYIGQFEMGKSHGIGTSIYSDGIVHNGQYELGHSHGLGTMTIPKDQTFRGCRIYRGFWNKGNYERLQPRIDPTNKP